MIDNCENNTTVPTAERITGFSSDTFLYVLVKR